jgi:polysaccharide export outer membrane protein
MTPWIRSIFFAAVVALLPATPSLYAWQAAGMGAAGQSSGTQGGSQAGETMQTPLEQSGQQAAQQMGGQSAGQATGQGLGRSAYAPEAAGPNTANPQEHADRSGLGARGNLPAGARPAQSAPTSFQLLVERMLGQGLPLYGHDLFSNPGTFAALPDAPPTTDYLISTGDQVLVRMWGPVTMNEALTVDRAGDIFLPQVGTIHVAGLAYAALAGQVRSEVSRVFRNFNLSVELGQLHSIQIFVTGEAERPGTYTVSSLSTLVNAVFASGGPSPVGSMRKIELRRDGQVVTTFDFYDLLLHGDKSKDAHLLPGDVIFIPPAGPEVGISGQVNVPAIYELKGEETLGALLQLAGGANSVASSAGVTLQQIVHHQYRETSTVPLTPAGLATPLEDGDLLVLGGISNRFENTVTIRGNLANPGRFAWHAGMRLSDILPEKAALLTQNYWEVRNAEGRPGPFLQALPSSIGGQLTAENELGTSVSTLPGSHGGVVTPGVGTTGTTEELGGVSSRIAVAPSLLTKVTIPAPEIDWSYAVIERTNRDTLRNQLLPFDLGRLVLDHDQTQNLPLEPGDVVTIFSQADFAVAQEQLTKFVRIEGEVGSAGVYSVHPGETLQSLVERAGGLTPEAYLFGAQFTRESTRTLQQQRLEEYVDKLSVDMERSTAKTALSLSGSSNDATVLTVEERLINQLRQQRATGRIVLDFKLDSEGVASVPPLPLENGDVLIVPSKPLIVNVIGSVPNQSSFLFRPKATVRYYLRLAGGPDRDSDPKHAFVIRANGAVLSRGGSGFWGDTFDGLQLAPGDTLVIPAKLFNPSILRTIIDSSSAFSSLALVAATVAIAQ